MKIIYSNKHKNHNPPFEIYDGVKEPYAEKAERIEAIAKNLRENGIADFVSPKHFPIKNILAVHQKEYLNFLERRSKELKNSEILYPSDFIMDTYTPIVNATFDAAVGSVDIALTGAQLILSGEKTVYGLCRPPGHHADYKTMGGYCYFNNASIAANFLSKKGKVAILDIDFHHGNGTQNTFYERDDVFYVSIHADPHYKFPYGSGYINERGKGKGLGFNKNYPLPLGIKNAQYLKTLHKALNDVRKFNPEFLIVSAGFDTYEKDPIGGFKLTIPFYETIGQQIAKLNLPTLIIQEGGYNVADLGKIAYSLLKGLG
jgi:acetoin utilization deacetylase AcuC-like enzyme